ncbi:hypothetical protein LWP59_10805 [Amycolatopsis acidiphila]|uniref:hypothetical protein n=1 Tax=Amycolatopsis acidiphila TaxID=715473 RepID=UPI001995DF34|nr:hypothetical protein [Amycolatopsis acidiphila]UIJ62070.1 hypothetical protein LWP59_10805 [Amycolatopsis acidiphila]GHG91719.1 hypothetical protein GCM10017788_67970 [Amycolatopsis acidiphila]
MGSVTRCYDREGPCTPGAASGATVERIRKLADELGFLATIYEGIEEAAPEHGLSTFVTNTRDVPEVQRARTEMMLGRRVDDLIFGDAGFLSGIAARCRSCWSATPFEAPGGRLGAEKLLAETPLPSAIFAAIGAARPRPANRARPRGGRLQRHTAGGRSR